MAKPILVLREDGYLLKVAGKESEEADYGTPVALTVGGKNYVAYVDLDENDEPVTCLEGLVYVGDVVEPDVENEDADAEPSQDAAIVAETDDGEDAGEDDEENENEDEEKEN